MPSPSATSTPTLFHEITRNVEACDEGWQNGPVLEGLVAIRNIRRRDICLPEVSFLFPQKLAEAMEKDKPPRIRKAAYDVVHAAQDGWVTSMGLRQTLANICRVQPPEDYSHSLPPDNLAVKIVRASGRESQDARQMIYPPTCSDHLRTSLRNSISYVHRKRPAGNFCCD